jgi:hypothetical protein
MSLVSQNIVFLCASLLELVTKFHLLFTEDYVEVGYWSMIEISIGIVCACMPACRALLSMVHQTISGSRGTKGSGNGSNRTPASYQRDVEGNHNNVGLKTIGSSSRNKKVLRRYSKFGNSTEITLDTTMTNPNWSDVELVAVEKAPSPQSTDGELLAPTGGGATSLPPLKRWSALSGNIRDTLGWKK